MTVLPDVAAGALWRCVDLHLHTPGVHSFSLPDGADVRTDAGRASVARQYVDSLAASGVTVGAITDYQGIREPWFSLIRQEAGQRGITILPGAELSLDIGKGLHLLIVCSASTPAGEIDRAIMHLDENGATLFTGRDSEHHEVRLRGSLEDALRKLRTTLGCVVVAAHAGGSKGIFGAIKVERVADLVEAGLVDAIEKCDNVRERFTSAGRRSARLDSLACTRGSDPKRIEDVGRTFFNGHQRVTWIKLSAFDADALRLALHDPQTRVLLRPPEPPTHPRVLSMSVDGGFLSGLVLRFSDDLTTLIGGRGAGKSAILETLRYALDLAPYSDQSERADLVKHALGTGGQVVLVVERPGPKQAQRFEVSRVYGQAPRARDLSSGTPVDVPPADLFGPGESPVILLQREIAAVSRSDDFRRRLLDEIIGAEAHQADLRVRGTVDRLRRNARAVEDGEHRLEQGDQQISRLAALDSEIGYFDRQGVSEKLDRSSKLGADGARLDTASASLSEEVDRLSENTDRVLGSLAETASGLAAGESEYADELVALSASLSAIRDRLSDTMSAASSELLAVRDAVRDAADRWPAHVSALAGELRRIQAELGSGQLDAQRYLDAVRERTALRPIVARLERHEADRARLAAERRELLALLQDERRAAFKLREKAAKKVNDLLAGKLRMSVTYLGDTAGFAARLSTVLRGSRVSQEAVEQVAAPNVDGVELARVVSEGPDAVAKRWALTPATAQRLVGWLTVEPKRLREIEVSAPEDRVSIALIVNSAARDLTNLSGGQRATALLLLLFAQGDRPLILDQPEDDLDNRFVYDDVVELLREEKGTRDPKRRRQIIAATHNANIPVNGDAELVLSLADNAGRCTVTCRGSIDDATVRQEIRTVLEGGEEAFRRRAEKYGGIDDPR